MRVLLTGGAGFIGTYLCRELLKSGHEITVLDLKPASLEFQNQLKHVQGNLLDQKLLQSLLKQVDSVVHFAAVVSVPICQNEPAEAYETNLTGTLGLLEQIRLANQKRERAISLVFASSSSVYGHIGQKNVPLREETLLKSPLSFYAAQKLACEHAVRLYSENFKIPSLSFRYFNVFGVGQDPTSPYSGVITIFSNAISEGKEIQLHGGGSQTRDFVHVTDIAWACRLALELPREKLMGQAVNLGSGENVTIAELANKMISCSQSSLKVRVTPERSGDVKYSLANIQMAESLLSWKPRMSLDAGLQEILDWAKASRIRKAG